MKRYKKNEAKEEKGTTGRRGAIEKLLGVFCVVNLIGTIAAFVALFNVDIPLKTGEYFEGSTDKYFDLIILPFLAFIVVSYIVYVIVTRFGVKSANKDTFTNGCIAYLMFIILTGFIFLIGSLASQAVANINVLDHNDAVTIQKIETAYDSAKQLDTEDKILGDIPNKAKVENANPYLVKKDGEEYVVYVSVDTEKDTANVMTETKLGDTAKPLKVLK